MAHTPVTFGHVLLLSAASFVGIQEFYWSAVLATPGWYRLFGPDAGGLALVVLVVASGFILRSLRSPRFDEWQAAREGDDG